MEWEWGEGGVVEEDLLPGERPEVDLVDHGVGLVGLQGEEDSVDLLLGHLWEDIMVALAGHQAEALEVGRQEGK